MIYQSCDKRLFSVECTLNFHSTNLIFFIAHRKKYTVIITEWIVPDAQHHHCNLLAIGKVKVTSLYVRSHWIKSIARIDFELNSMSLCRLNFISDRISIWFFWMKRKISNFIPIGITIVLQSRFCYICQMMNKHIFRLTSMQIKSITEIERDVFFFKLKISLNYLCW